MHAYFVVPGIASTALFNKVSPEYPFGLFTYTLGLVIGQTPLQGAQSTIYAATEPSLKGKGGIMLGPQYPTNLFHTYERYPANPRAFDHEARAILWERTFETLKEITHGDEEDVMPGVLKGRAGGSRTGGVGLEPQGMSGTTAGL
jgi:hypothetical protein